MFFTDIILDLDNTLYDYSCHFIAIDLILKDISSYYNIEISELKNKYNIITNKLKTELNNSASSHNRTIYFKQLFDYYKLPLSKVNNTIEQYWKYYYDNMKLNDGVYDLLVFLKKLNINIHILTDFTLLEQIKKLEKLNIIHFFDNIISSEEIGIEKPSIKNFSYFILKTNIDINKTIFIGDDFEKDILGSTNMNMFALFYNTKFKSNKKIRIYDKYIEFSSFIDLKSFFKKYSKKYNKLENLSKYYGQRYDFIQAGGGNISVKCEDLMLIKSSGTLLSDISKYNHSIINNFELKNDIENDKYDNILKYTIFNKNIPSIETYMHSFLKKYVIHLHPIQSNNLSESDIKKIFNNVLILDYFTPGKELSENLHKYYNNENIIFLLNHGIIFTTDKYSEIYDLISNTINKIENYLNIDFIKYKFVNEISDKIGNITFLSEDKIIYDNFNKLKEYKIIFPDQLIYCGENILFINDKSQIKKSIIIVYQNNVYINSNNLNKCRHIESVLKSYLQIKNNNNLSDNDISKINNSEMEKYRKNKENL